jgi:competence protein ComEC
MKVFFFPIIPISIFYCLGIYIYAHFNLTLTHIIFIFCILFLAYLIVNRFKNKETLTVILLLIWTNIAFLVCNINNHRNYISHYTNTKNSKEIVLVVEEKIKSTDKYNKYVAQIVSIGNENSFGKVIVYTEKNIVHTLNIGTEIIVYGQLQPIYEVKNPYQFSYAKYLTNQNIYAQIKLSNENFKIIRINTNINYYVNSVRQSLINSFNIHDFSSITQQFINAFLLGQRQELNSKLNEQYSQAGVVHILAISGLHISILYGILLLTFKALHFGYKQRYLQLILSLLFLWGFALITGLSPSVVRSVAMFSIIAIALTFGKNRNIYNAMAISLIIILLISPYMLFDVGFQLSYMSVLIIVISNPLLKKIHFTPYKIVHYAIDLIAISFLVQLFLLPIILYYFNQFPILFLVSNLLVIPLSSFILYLLVVVLILNYILPSLAIILGKITAILIEQMNNYVGWIASFKDATIQNIPFNELLFVTAYLFIIALFLLFFKINYKRIQVLLISYLAMLCGFIYTHQKQINSQLYIVWNEYKQTLITHHTKNEINIYTTKTKQIETNINQLKQHFFYKKINIKPVQNYYTYKDQKIALINTKAYYNNNDSITHLILVQSPKINLERVLNVYKPKYVISDASNYKSYVDRWEQTCKQKNIPFYNTYKMGYYSIKTN